MKYQIKNHDDIIFFEYGVGANGIYIGSLPIYKRTQKTIEIFHLHAARCLKRAFILKYKHFNNLDKYRIIRII